MPRRPRPGSRTTSSRATHPKRRPQRISDDDKTSPSEVVATTHSDGSSDEEEVNENETVSLLYEDEDVDAPRVAQWAGESDLEDEDGDEDEEGADEPAAGPSSLDKLQDDISQLPLGTLLRAQRALAQGEAEQSDSEAESLDSKPVALTSKKDSNKVEWSTMPRTDIAKRRNKHAPTEVTSKRPVPRRTAVVEVKAPQLRDPRFLPLAGTFDTHKFHQQYGFLSTSRQTELSTLRDNLKRARKLLENSPRALREEREAEVSRLEHAVKRMESLVQHDKREKVEEEALKAVKREETQKRKAGKSGWWLKESAKKELLAKARYDALAAQGGRQAVKKAIEKKQKKISQKEKRSRPYAREEGQGAQAVKRRRVG